MIQFKFIDAIDIIVVAVIIYYFLSFIREAKAIRMMAGLIILLFIGIIASTFKLDVLSFIIKGLGAAWVIVFIILFQPEIRSALSRLGKTTFGRLFTREEYILLDKIVNSVNELVQKRYGGIIVIEKNNPLNQYISTGCEINAKLLPPIITTIFTPKSPLHDGAVILRGDTIVSAACILPLSEKNLPHNVGTRHRAALGISEETDAVVIVISEETSEISIAYNGEFHKVMQNELKKELSKIL